MIIISAGTQKAGTGWYFNMTNDLLVATGHQDVRQLRNQFHLHTMLKYHNCNVGRPMLIKLLVLMVPHILGNTFVVKTHSGPPSTWSLFAALRVAKAAYISRDPRDIVVSAFEHGEKIRQQGEVHSFACLKSIEDAIYATKEWLEREKKWLKSPATLLARYEDLLTNPLKELTRLADFLELPVDRQVISDIIAAYRPETLDEKQKSGLHFNIGQSQRFRQVLNSEQIRTCNHIFGSYLEQMGYGK